MRIVCNSLSIEHTMDFMSVSKKLFGKSLTIKARIQYVVNFLLIITFVFALISGISTSQVLFPSDNHDSIWRGIHHFCGAVSMILIGIHLGLHWSFIIGMLKKVVIINKKVAKPLSIIFLTIVLSFGIYNAATGSFASWLAEPFVTQVKEQQTSDDKYTTVDTITHDKNENKGSDNMNDHTPKR